MRHKKSIFAAIAAFAALTASAVLLAVIYARNKYLPYLLTALQLALPAAIGAILILFGRDIPLREHTDAPFPDNCRRIKRVLLRVGRAIRRFCQGAARIFNRIRTPAAALLIILSAGFTIAAFAVFRTRMTSVYSLDYLPPVLLAVLFVIYIAVEKWCAHVTPDGNEDAYSSAVLGNLRTALATGRISLALCAVASTLKLLGLYDLQKALTIVLTVIFGYEALFILLCEAVRHRAVDVQHTPKGLPMHQRQDDLGIGRAVAGNMTGEFMDVSHPHRPALPGRRAAHAPAHGDPDTGRLALEGAQDQLVAHPFIKAHPVNLRQHLPKEGGGIGKIADLIGHILHQSGKRPAQLRIIYAHRIASFHFSLFSSYNSFLFSATSF